jgi:hypothetical protein
MYTKSFSLFFPGPLWPRTSSSWSRADRGGVNCSLCFTVSRQNLSNHLQRHTQRHSKGKSPFSHNFPLQISLCFSSPIPPATSAHHHLIGASRPPSISAVDALQPGNGPTETPPPASVLDAIVHAECQRLRREQLELWGGRCVFAVAQEEWAAVKWRVPCGRDGGYHSKAECAAAVAGR